MNVELQKAKYLLVVDILNRLQDAHDKGAFGTPGSKETSEEMMRAYSKVCEAMMCALEKYERDKN